MAIGKFLAYIAPNFTLLMYRINSVFETRELLSLRTPMLRGGFLEEPSPGGARG